MLQGLGLVFVAVYQKALSLLYVEELLQRIKEAFVSQYEPDCYKYPSFETTFQRILKDCEAKADAARRQSPPQQQGQQQGQPRGQQLANGKQHGRGAGGKGQPSSEEEDSEDGAAGAAGGAAAGASDTAGSSEDETTTAAALVSSCVCSLEYAACPVAADVHRPASIPAAAEASPSSCGWHQGAADHGKHPQYQPFTVPGL